MIEDNKFFFFTFVGGFAGSPINPILRVPIAPKLPFNMRLLPISLLSTLFASVVLAQSGDGSDEASDVPKPTIFNGVEVPPLPEIDGESFNKTVADGYWFVKHHS